MKKLRLILFALVLGGTFLWNSCSNDFELTDTWQEIPVVYAILSPGENAYYVRVEKAFLDPETSAFVTAQIADSLYYPENSIAVYLQRDGNSNLFQLSRVDGNLEGFKRDSGIFATTPNWLYKIKASEIEGGLKEGQKYKLVIKRADGQPDITAETTIPKAFTLVTPNPTTTPPRINFLGDLGTTFRWSHDENAVFFNVYLTIPYREEIPGETTRRDTIQWKAASNVQAASATSESTLTQVLGNDFYTVIKNRLVERYGSVENVPVASRYFGNVTITVEGGGKEIREFRLTAEANSGLTGAEIVQTYSNLSEGFGIFSAKNTTVKNGFKVENETIEAMKLSPIVQNFTFK